jgi:hypothetical protein
VDKTDPAGPLVDVTGFEPSRAGAFGARSDLNRFWQQLLGTEVTWQAAASRTSAAGTIPAVRQPPTSTR